MGMGLFGSLLSGEFLSPSPSCVCRTAERHCHPCECGQRRVKRGRVGGGGTSASEVSRGVYCLLSTRTTSRPRHAQGRGREWIEDQGSPPETHNLRQRRVSCGSNPMGRVWRNSRISHLARMNFARELPEVGEWTVGRGSCGSGSGCSFSQLGDVVDKDGGARRDGNLGLLGDCGVLWQCRHHNAVHVGHWQPVRIPHGCFLDSARACPVR